MTNQSTNDSFGCFTVQLLRLFMQLLHPFGWRFVSEVYSKFETASSSVLHKVHQGDGQYQHSQDKVYLS